MGLLKNDNHKFIRLLTSNCMKANKSRNRIAILAIMLTAMLFTCIITVVQGTQLTVKEQQLRQSGTRFMVSMKYMAPDKALFLKDHPAFSETGMIRMVGMGINPEWNNLNVNIGLADENYIKNCYMTLTQGRLPEKENEIACDTQLLNALGLPETPGTTFNLQYTVGQEERQQTVTVSGVWNGSKNETISTILISEAFLMKNLPPDAETEGRSNYLVYGSFEDTKNIDEQLDHVIAEAGYTPDAKRGEPGFLVHNTSSAYQQNNTLSAGVVMGAAALLLIILLAGYLIIYNIFQISVMKDIRLFGQLKTIGTSPKQIRAIIRNQGMRLSLMAIPGGLLLGWLLGNALLPLIMASTTFSKTTFILPNPWIWILAALFTLLTVRLSTIRPGRIASRMAPIEALNYQEKIKNRKQKRAGKTSRHRLFHMAAANLARNKGKTVLVVLSISLSILLLNSVLNVIGCFDKEIYIRRFTPTDFNIYSVAREDIKKTVPQTFTDQLIQQNGVANVGKIWYHALPSEQETEETIHVEAANGKAIDPQSPDYNYEDILMAYGVNEAALRYMDVVEGTLDYQKLETGNYIVTLLTKDDQGELNKEAQHYHPGDQLTITLREGVTKTVEVMAVMAVDNPFLMDKSIGGYDYIGFSENVFKSFYPENPDPIHLVFNTDASDFDAVNTFINNHSQMYNLGTTTRLSAEADFNEIVSTYRMAGGILSGVFGVIGLLNLINVILTGAVTRQHEFAVMQSIGMTRRQLKKLFVLEGILYAVLSAGIGILLSCILSLTAVRGISQVFWFGNYHFDCLPALMSAMVLLVVTAIISVFADEVLNNGSMIENLNHVE